MMEIPLTQGKIAIIDDEDYNSVSKYNWQVRKSYNVWYALRSSHTPIRKTIFLHRFLLHPKSNERCDHINGDGLDNRRINLRIATFAQNQMNRRKNPGFSSRFKGVMWNKQHNKWMTQIKINKKQIHLGYFSDEVEAAKAYNVAALEHFGEYARLNQFKEK